MFACHILWYVTISLSLYENIILSAGNCKNSEWQHGSYTKSAGRQWVYEWQQCSYTKSAGRQWVSEWQHCWYTKSAGRQWVFEWQHCWYTKSTGCKCVSEWQHCSYTKSIGEFLWQKPTCAPHNRITNTLSTVPLEGLMVIGRHIRIWLWLYFLA